jgi:hypothetical protein
MRRLLPLAAVAAVAATAAPAHAAPSCSGLTAMTAVEDNEPLVTAIRATGALQPDENVFDVFQLTKLTCADLTGDGKKEMAVYLTCCTAASPTPFAIFRPDGDAWAMAYRSTRLLIDKQTRRGRRIYFRHPVYKRTDPLCCPSSERSYVLEYKGGKFRRRSA